MKTSVAIVSGGLDSTTLAYLMRQREPSSHLVFVSFDYGQKHSKELSFARHTADALDAEWRLIDMSFLGADLKSALTTPGEPVPEGHYAAANMKLTVVPNRNAIMLSIAWGIAVSCNASMLGLGVHAGDHAIYPDCRPEFVRAMNEALRLGNEGFGDHRLHLFAPFVYATKSEIVKIGLGLGVDYSQTWSCYVGGEKPCLKCGTCVERLEAFEQNGVRDPLDWRE